MVFPASVVCWILAAPRAAAGASASDRGEKPGTALSCQHEQERLSRPRSARRTEFGAAMQDLAARALDTAQVLGASYADVRVERRESQSITVKNGHVDGLSDDTSQGFGVRVVVDGGWGFASSARLEPAEVDRAVRRAAETAGASPPPGVEPVQLGEPVRSRGTYRTPLRRDPFDVSL